MHWTNSRNQDVKPMLMSVLCPTKRYTYLKAIKGKDEKKTKNKKKTPKTKYY